MEYLLNPDLPVHPAQADRWRGNPVIDGQFQYLRHPFRASWPPVLKMLLTRNPQRAQKKADSWVTWRTGPATTLCGWGTPAF